METKKYVTFMSVLSLLAPLVPSGQSLLHAQQAPAELQRRGETPRITMQPMTLAHSIDEFAGQQVRVLNARVARVFDQRAFLIEPVAPYTMHNRFYDGVLVLSGSGNLRVSSEVVVGSTVTILGTARTLLGARVSPELPWPHTLDRDLIKDLKLRAAVLATSVQTPEGIELTMGRGSSPGAQLR